MDRCAICKLPLRNHESALRVLGELPFDTVKSIMQHQWHKDVLRIIYAHAQYYHDQALVDYSQPHRQQLCFLKEDIKRHRTKYILHCLHAIVEAHRVEGVGATQVTMEHEISIRVKLEDALSCELPSDLDAVFRQAKPYEWKGTITWEQSKQNGMHMANHMFGRGSVRDVVDRRLITAISIIVQLNGGTEGDKFATFIPKTPDPMWCWNQTTEQIQGFQHMTKLDLF
ncbi:hypothetical protein GQX73_g7007 [Xylaria multiplex]|uniref:Uncharacterized protein n=1 Tax=Xylaria multiplex TaxID=323545 RepID=A0A7C8N2A3_9PEZI|nr:hypothetical protein GQX73_g7007 [Xylaria multiplex]